MKPEYAIEVLTRYRKSIESDFTNPEETEPVQAYNTAIAALEKQIPKKPNNKRFSRNYELAEHNIMEGECPNCDDTVTGNSYGYYCGGCGQAID